MRCFFISLGDRIVCDLKDRVYECKNCGAVIDRDLNAAVNLKNQIKEKIGGATPELTPVELTALQDCFKSTFTYLYVFIDFIRSKIAVNS